MAFLKDAYRNSTIFLGDTPQMKSEWRQVLTWSVFIYLVVLAFRLSFAGRWDHPELWVSGERILSTHDSYFWLALAKGVGSISQYALAQVTRFIHETSGIGLGTLAFWAPAYMASLVAVVAFLWGWLLGGVSAGIFAGLVSSLVPGFYYRTRLGYYDTDMFTLLVPMLIAWFLAFWASFHTKNGWFSTDSDSAESNKYYLTPWLVLAFGLVARALASMHFDLTKMNVMFVYVAVGLILLAGRKGHKVRAMYELLVFALAAFPGSAYGLYTLHPLRELLQVAGYGKSVISIGITSIVLAITIALFLSKREKISGWAARPLICLCICVGAVFVMDLAVKPISAFIGKFVSYAGLTGTASSEATQTVSYPSILQSIIETKHVSFAEILERAAYWPWLGVVGTLCSAIVLLFRPRFLLIVPQIALTYMSILLGARFTMFGGTAMLIGVGVFLDWVIRRILPDMSKKVLVLAAVQCVSATLLLGIVYSAYAKLPLTPVLTKPHAEALIELGKQTDGNSMLWTWWDWGYASQYFSGLETTIDGGKHSGQDVFPTALVLSTDSPLQANHMIRYASQYKARLALGYDVAKAWRKIPASETMKIVNGMREKNVSYPVKAKQYLAVTWKDLTISKWITYFGNWNLETGRTREATVSNFEPGELGFNLQRGAIMNRQGGGGLVRDITVLDWNSRI